MGLLLEAIDELWGLACFGWGPSQNWVGRAGRKKGTRKLEGRCIDPLSTLLDEANHHWGGRQLNSMPDHVGFYLICSCSTPQTGGNWLDEWKDVIDFAMA